MYPIMKYVDKALSLIGRGLFNSIQFFNRRVKPSPTFIPKWSDKPLQKSWQKTKPTLGWPRETDSLCPVCVREVRAKILSGELDYRALQTERLAEIKAQIVERNNQIWIVKECPKHGKFEDMISLDANFHAHIEANYPGRDIDAHNDTWLHNHGSSSITHGRGAVLNVDLTNRCNMMCDPCFTDANQVGFVHELSLEEIKEVLDSAISLKPRRQLSVQFSGGEPTLSPHFLEAIRYARKVGYNSVQCASNGLRFAQDPEFAKAAGAAGLRYCYLQFDGIGEDANSHRKISNLFDVKLRAIENLHNGGVEIILVVTIVNNLNNDQVGPIVEFAMKNPRKIAFVAFQPVSFTGRDEEISDERRLKQRYTLAHLAHDVKKQAGITEPLRDWFPLSLFSVFSDFADHVHGANASWGMVHCGSHPDCGAGTAVMINKATGEMAPFPQFVNIPQLMADVQSITDAGRTKWFSNLLMALAMLKNYDPFQAPKSLSILDILKKFDKHFALSNKSYGVGVERRKDPWNFLFIAAMWFQDLFTYDFRRTELCSIPYGTQEGEISFCAYNTGIGWRNILEKVHQNATVAQWYKRYGRHAVYSGGKEVPLESTDHSLYVNPEHAARVRSKGDGPQNAHDEVIAKRKAMQKQLLSDNFFSARAQRAKEQDEEVAGVAGD